MDSYSIPDLIKLLRTERGERVRLIVGFPPILLAKGESHEIEGPLVVDESVEEMLRTVASTREMRTFRETGSMDIVVPFDGARFLVRAIRAFGDYRVELQVIPL